MIRFGTVFFSATWSNQQNISPVEVMRFQSATILLRQTIMVKLKKKKLATESQLRYLFLKVNTTTWLGVVSVSKFYLAGYWDSLLFADVSHFLPANVFFFFSLRLVKIVRPPFFRPFLLFIFSHWARIHTAAPAEFLYVFAMQCRCSRAQWFTVTVSCVTAAVLTCVPVTDRFFYFLSTPHQFSVYLKF